MKKTKLERLFALQEKLYLVPKNINGNYNKKWNLTKNRIHKINSEILIAQFDELFFIEVEAVLNDKVKPWCCGIGYLHETNYWLEMLGEARDGDKDSLKLLRAEFKPNPAFKKETARFARFTNV